MLCYFRLEIKALEIVKKKKKRERKGALQTCVVLMYQQLCAHCRAWLTEGSPENEHKGVCVHVCRALTRVGTYLSAYNAMNERVRCVLFSAFGGMSYGDNDPLLARRCEF